MGNAAVKRRAAIRFNFQEAQKARGVIRELEEQERERGITVSRMNVGTIGHVDHGKTTLTAAIEAAQNWEKNND